MAILCSINPFLSFLLHAQEVRSKVSWRVGENTQCFFGSVNRETLYLAYCFIWRLSSHVELIFGFIWVIRPCPICLTHGQYQIEKITFLAWVRLQIPLKDGSFLLAKPLVNGVVLYVIRQVFPSFREFMYASLIARWYCYLVKLISWLVHQLV